MARPTLEARVTALEELVAQIMSKGAPPEAQKNWRTTIGMFAGDSVQKEIDEAAKRIREADRRRSRP